MKRYTEEVVDMAKHYEVGNKKPYMISTKGMNLSLGDLIMKRPGLGSVKLERWNILEFDIKYFNSEEEDWRLIETGMKVSCNNPTDIKNRYKSIEKIVPYKDLEDWMKLG